MLPLLILAALASQGAAAELQHDLLSAGPGAARDRAAQALVHTPVHLGEPRVLSSSTGHTVRFDQQHRGLPVLGASAAVRVLPDGRVPFVSSSLNTGLSVDPTPSVDLAEAVSTAGLDPYPVRQGQLAVLPLGQGELVWDIRVATPGDVEQVLVNAHSGVVHSRRSLRRDSLGRVYEENPVRTPETSDVELSGLDGHEELTGFDGGLQVLNHVSGGIHSDDLVGSRLGPSEGEDYLYDPPADPSDAEDGFAQVNAWYHLSSARSYFEGLTGEDMSSEAWDLAVLTNLHDADDGGPVDNAFYVHLADAGDAGEYQGAPNLIAVGQGTTVDFSLDADVLVHEAVHYLSDNAVGFNQGQLHATEHGLSPWSGAVEEGVSDYFAVSFFDDPVLGEVSLGASGAERDLSSQGRHCPEDVMGEVHEDGELIGAFGWALREAYGADAADQMMWGATTLMTGDSTLGDFAAGAQQVAGELLEVGEIESLQALDEALVAGGLDSCGVVQDLGEEPLVLQLWGLDRLGSVLGVDCVFAAGWVSMPVFFQFRVETDADDDGLAVAVELEPEHEPRGDLSWRVYLRQGQPVTFQVLTLFPSVDAYDVVSDEFRGVSGKVTVEGEDFAPGEPWYGIVVSRSCPSARASITAEALGAGDDGGGADGDDEGSSDADGGGGSGSEAPGEYRGGCGCAASSPTRGGLWGLGLMGLALGWRRPRVRSRGSRRRLHQRRVA